MTSRAGGRDSAVRIDALSPRYRVAGR